MSVQNGNIADENTFNTSFISREVDSSTIGKIDLLAPSSGGDIINIQQVINNILLAIGDLNNDYSSNVYITDGEDHVVSLGKLDAALDLVEVALTALQADVANGAEYLRQYADETAYAANHVVAQGSIFFDTTLNLIRYYNGTQWVSTEELLASKTVAFANDAAYEAVYGVGQAGSFYYNTTSNVIRYYDAGGAAWADLGADVFNSFLTYANDAAYEAVHGVGTGGDAYYNSTTGAIRYYDGVVGEWTDVGTGSGFGINYLEGWDRDTNWTDGANITIAENTTDPIRDTLTRDLLLSKAAVDASTEYVYIPFTIDDADLGKVLPLTFDYKNLDVNYADGYFEIELHDVTNAVVVPNSNPEILANELGNTHRTYFQAAIDSNSYEMRIKVITTSASLMDMRLSNFRCGPQNLVGSTSFQSDWIDFTPTWFNDNDMNFTTNIAKWKRDGQDMLVWVQVLATGTGTSGSVLLFQVPEGKEILLGNVDGTAAAYPAGQFFDSSGSTSTQRFHSLQWSAFTNTDIHFTCQDRGSLVGPEVATSDRISLMMRIPIVGWESGTKPNEVITGRKIAAKLADDSGQSIPNDTITKVTWNTVERDTVGGWDSINNRWYAPESDDYSIKAKVTYNTLNWSVAANVQIYIGINGIINSAVVDEFDDLSGFNVTKTVQINEEYYLNKGDYVEFFTYQKSGVAEPLDASLARNKFTISRINSLNSQLAPSDYLNMHFLRLSSDDAQSMAHNVFTTIKFNNTVEDTAGGWDFSTGVYTFKKSGKVDIGLNIALVDPTGPSIGDDYIVRIIFNGTSEYSAEEEASESTGTTISYSATASVVGHPVNAGDTLRIDYFQNSGAAYGLANQAFRNWLTLKVY